MKLVFCILAAVSLAACATKQYPIATRLSPQQMSGLTCEQLELEQSETLEVRRQINETAETDWRSVAGFLGDYGIGNAMARHEADVAVKEREETIARAIREQGC